MRKNTSFQTFSKNTIEQVATHASCIGGSQPPQVNFCRRNWREENATQLVAATGLSQANVSKHLQILTESGILVRRKKGIYVF